MTSTTASTVTIRRSAALERKVLRAVRLQWVLAAGIFWVPVFLATATMYLFAVYARAGWATLAGLAIALPGIVNYPSLARARRRHRVERRLRGVYLVLSPQGVAYGCVAGEFSAPWSAVRRVAVRGRPGTRWHCLLVDVDGWGGPLDISGQVCVLQLPVAGAEAEIAAIGQSLPVLSDGRLSLGSVA